MDNIMNEVPHASRSGGPSATPSAVVMTQANGFVCVSWWRDKGNPVPPYKGSYSYEHFDTAEEAYECHREYEAGEFANASARGVFAAKDGMPIGGRIL